MILVAGGAGYIGSHFCRILSEKGEPFIVLDDLSRGDARFVSAERLITGRIGDASLVERLCEQHKVDVAVHFAAFAYVGESVEEPAIYYENNVVQTLGFLDGLRKAGVKRLVFSSTCATYGIPKDGASIDERTDQRPINPYGQSKLFVERILDDYDRAYGFRSICLRYFNAAGTAPAGDLYEQHEPETHLIPLAIRAALGLGRLTVYGQDYATPDGTCIRDYVHVDDLAEAHLAAIRWLQADCDSARINLGLGRGYSVLEVLDAVKHATGHDVPFQVGPRRPGDPPSLVASNDFARRALGWTPRYDTIDKIVETSVLGERRRISA